MKLVKKYFTRSNRIFLGEALSLLSLGLVLLCSSALAADSRGVDFTFINTSQWRIAHLFLSPINESEWGTDQLDKQVIESAETFVLKNITPGSYDIRVVDEEGDECIVEDVGFEVDQAIKMSDEKLVACQAATKLDEHEPVNEE